MKLKHSVGLLLITQLVAGLALADPTPTPSPSPAQTVTLTPDNLRTLLLSDNNQILISLNNVHIAKTNIDNARVGLLPSININFNLPTFALSSVSFLLPFLVPSNWFALAASNHELTADENAYFIMELDTYASVYAMYEVVASDMELRAVLNQQYLDYAALESFLENEATAGLPVTPSDLEQAQAQTQAALAAVSKMDETITQEKFQIGMALALSPDTVINITPVEVAPSSMETATSFDALTEQAFSMSPEKQQQDALIAAAQDEKWSALFSWIGTNTLGDDSNNSGTSNQIDFSNMQDRGTINLGLGIFTSYALSKENVTTLQLEETAIEQQIGANVGSTISSITLAINQYNDALAAEQLQQQALVNAVQDYENGSSTIQTVIQEQQTMIQFSTTRIQAQADINAQRITLNRTFLTDEFGNIKGCNINQSAKKQGGWPIFNWIGHLFHPGAGQQTLDQMCKSTS
jgi:multidrug efflux system outer membrane protein